MDLGASLDRLLDAEILFQRGMAPDAVLTFKHALFEEVAYATLAAGRRRRLHAAAARTLPALDPQLASSNPEVVAGHWSAGGSRAEALTWWRRAGQRALERSAFAEAAHDFEQALAARRAVRDRDTRRSLELDLRLNLSVAETGRDGGQAPPGVVRSLRRVNALSSGLDEGDALARALLLLSRLYIGLAYRRVAMRLLSRLTSICDRVEDPYLAAAIQCHISVVLTLRGDFAAADYHYEACVQSYAMATPRAPGQLAVDPLAMALEAASWRSWLRGRDAESRSHLEAATTQADRWERDFISAYIRLHATPPVLLRGDLATATRLVRGGIAHAGTAGSQGLVDLGRALEACIAVTGGETSVSMRRLSEVLAALDPNSFRLFRPVLLLYLAKAHELEGGISSALTVLDEALEHDRRRQDSLLLPEIQRRRGEVLARLGRAEDAERAFGGALRAARRYGSFTLELRAASSLARYRAAKGLASAARRTLRATLERMPADVDVVEREEAQVLAESLGVHHSVLILRSTV